MSKVRWNPAALVSPIPAALISSGTMEKPNVMTAAWTGMLNSTPPMAYVSIQPIRYSHGLVRESGEFVINLTTRAIARATDYCGVKSGRDEDKFQTAGLSAAPSFEVSCPSVAESPVSIECRVFEIKTLGSHDLFMANIVAVAVSEELIDPQNRLALENAGLISYIHGEYYAQGDFVGHFGYSVRKKGGPLKR